MGERFRALFKLPRNLYNKLYIKFQKCHKKGAIVLILFTIVILVCILLFFLLNRHTDLTIEKVLSLHTKDEVVRCIGKPDRTKIYDYYELDLMGERYTLLISYSGDGELCLWSFNYLYKGMLALDNAWDMLDYEPTLSDQSEALRVLEDVLQSFSNKFGKPEIYHSKVDTTTYSWIVNDRKIDLYDYTCNPSLALLGPVQIDINCDYQSFCKHTEFSYEAADASCLEDGYSRKVCNFCGYTEGTTFPALGHENTSTVTKAPTCTESGEQELVCSRCGMVETEIIDQLPHTFQDVLLIAPTCLENGTKKQQCTVCGYETQDISVPALGHNYQETILQNASCESDGICLFTCALCDDSYTAPIPALGHSMSTATCTEPEICSRCGKTGANAHGHNWAYDGWHTTACSYCSAVYQPNIHIVGRNLPYTSDGATIHNVWLSDKSGVYLDSSGNAVISAWLEFSYSTDTSSPLYTGTMLHANLYNSSGQLLKTVRITVMPTYCDYVVVDLPDNDTYYIEFT